MDISHILSIDFIYNLARGPLVWISFLVLLLGTVARTWRFLSLTQLQTAENQFHLAPPLKRKSPRKFSLKDMPEYWRQLKLTILGTSPATIVISVIFHVCLIIVPIFLLAHNILLDESIGFGLFSFSEKTTDTMTVIFLLCGLYFLVRRVFLPRVRAISTFYDYVILAITTAPFLTGFLAYYQIMDYKTIIVLHMLSGELMLMAIPFTKVFHMVFFFVGRFMIINQHTLGKGNRTW